MQKKILILGLVVVMLSASAVVFAGSPWTEKATYSEKVTAKLSFGYKNLLGGWTELFTEPASGEGNVFQGIGRGLTNFVVYTAGGALHLVTFLIPQIDIPLPGNGI